MKDEQVLLKSFIKHYENQGVDKIFLLDDNSKSAYPESILRNPNVVIIKSVNARKLKRQMYDANELYKHLRHKVKWVMNIDADEFIYSRRQNTTLRNELMTTFKSVYCVFVPWIMFAFNNKKHEPDDVIKS